MLSRPILFDLDGTLTDPKPGITLSIVHALEQLGRPAPEPDDLAWCIGPPIQESLAQILESDDEALIGQAVGHYRERFGQIGLFENEVYPHVRSMLTTLRDLGHRMFVATTKPTVYAEKIIRHFELHPLFSHVYGSEMDGTNARKGDLIRHIVHQEGLKHAVMVGDRGQDMAGAKENELVAIGVLYGYGTREELTQAGADDLASTPSDVLLAIARLP